MVGDEGERPDDVSEEELDQLDMGDEVYDEDGNKLGTVRGFDGGGFYVTLREGIESLSVEHARSGHEFGEAELMWRCTECGEMGDLEEELPENCPNCGEPKEALMYWTED